MTPTPASTPLLADIRLLIDGARQRVASAVNAELTQLYWHIGRRISTELLQGQRAEYGKQVVAELARQLTVDFGKGWSEQQLSHCMRLAEIFVDEQILSTVRRELSWSHLKTLIYIDAPLKRDFYIEICRLEHWSVRQLQERINSLLYERTAISKSLKKPFGKTSNNSENKANSRLTLPFATPMCWTFLVCPTATRKKTLNQPSCPNCNGSSLSLAAAPSAALMPIPKNSVIAIVVPINASAARPSIPHAVYR